MGMNKGATGFIKGIGMGIAVGTAVGAMSSMYVRNNKKGIKKNIGKALRNVGSLMDDVTGMF